MLIIGQNVKVWTAFQIVLLVIIVSGYILRGGTGRYSSRSRRSGNGGWTV